jgi:hypothetical protein
VGTNRILLAIAFAGALAARSHDIKKPAEARGENESVVITAKLYNTAESVKELLGSDLGGHYTVLAVEVTPRFGKEVVINHDDFVLKTDQNGEKSTPFAPSEIAGRGALVISSTGGGGGGVQQNNAGPIWGGIPGTSTRPHRVGGDGSTTGPPPDPEAAQAKTNSGAAEKENPILAVLKEKHLPETTTKQPVSGLLYFPLEKQRPKDLELRYVTDDKITMRFHQER